MALKVLFLTTCTLVWLYWLQVPDVAGSFSSITCRQFRRVERTFLYDFVTYSEQVDKWLSIVTFVASDQRPLGVGKTYKVVIDSSTVLHFNVTDYIPFRHIALEAPTGFLRPRLEVWFFSHHRNARPSSSTIGDKPPQPERPSAPNDPKNTIIIDTRSAHNGSDQSLPIELASSSSHPAESSSTKLPPQTGVHNGDGGRQRCGCCSRRIRSKVMDNDDSRCDEAVKPTANVISGDVEHHHRCQHHHEQHQVQNLQQLEPENGPSSLGLKFYFKHNSFLFQHTLGRLLRLQVERHFRRSLRHLELILDDIETLHRELYRPL
ncbi:uncharacterized protein LOC109419698 [Aedes albopictus]|uniref:Secreted protein n=1 Tax=Aedes albopictus TaxID=7160 RepID=A0ABM1ZUS5_AEDAL|nr:uncharacterized protein LOC109419698 [Aedes albopictus]XP_029733498.1 uncharacterized protein LOC109419698 [Aedes albopictus]